MAIMRSLLFIVFMKEMKDKVRRKRVNWFQMMVDLGINEVEHHYIMLQRKLFRGKCFSSNRCAYYALRNYYSTTSIDDTYYACLDGLSKNG